MRSVEGSQTIKGLPPFLKPYLYTVENSIVFFHWYKELSCSFWLDPKRTKRSRLRIPGRRSGSSCCTISMVLVLLLLVQDGRPVRNCAVAGLCLSLFPPVNSRPGHNAEKHWLAGRYSQARTWEWDIRTKHPPAASPLYLFECSGTWVTSFISFQNAASDMQPQAKLGSEIKNGQKTN